MKDQPQKRPGQTNYDWINGMRVGTFVGAIFGILIGWALGQVSFIWLVIGGAAGGYLGAKMAYRW